jgi:hypothetical protein
MLATHAAHATTQTACCDQAIRHHEQHPSGHGATHDELREHLAQLRRFGDDVERRLEERDT